MAHTVGKQGLVVPFGYVTVQGNPRPFQQGQYIPAGAVITMVEGDNENDEARNTATLKRLCGIDKEPAKPKE